MKYGFVLPKGDAKTAAELAVVLEQAGWDGLFVWEPVWGVDAWVSLTAAAMRTTHIHLGTMLSPLSRMRPWDVAGKVSTLNHLSKGRVILTVGLGATDTGFEHFGEVTERKTRAELLDESLDIITGLWRGQPFEYEGKHYKLKPFTRPEFATPVTAFAAPIWVVGALGHARSMKRALNYQGLVPTLAATATAPARQPTPAEFSTANLSSDPAYDIVVEGQTWLEEAASFDIVRAWQSAGATWWIEAMWDALDKPELVFARAKHGPPR